MYYWLDVSSGVLGEEQTFDIDTMDETIDLSQYPATVTYRCGGYEGTIVSKTNQREITWTPPLELAESNTMGSHVSVTLTVITYFESEEIAQRSVDVFYSIPSSVAPTFTVEFSDAAGYKEIYGNFLQLRSRLKIKVNPTTLYGATVDSCKIMVNSEIFFDTEAIASEIDSTGNIQVSIFLTDSRNKTTQNNFYVYFREYSAPSVSALTVKRCNSDGTSNNQGEYVQVTYSARATSLDNKNTVSYKLEYKKSTDSEFSVVNLPQFTNKFYIADETYIFAASTGDSYVVRFTVTDAFGSTVRTNLASTTATIMHFKADGKGIGLGKVSESENTVDVGWEIDMNSHHIKNVATPVEDNDAVNKAYADGIVREIFPVGAIYISTKETSPASIFGGTWEQILDTFLLAAGATYKAGETGGSATHTLTIEEMPSHSHDLVTGVIENPYIPTWGDGQKFPPWYDDTHSSDSFIKATGGGAAHNNMPPYLTVYIWKRTA
jgi:hypothetical protein